MTATLTKAHGSVTADDDGENGSFDIVLSAQSTDRDGDTLTSSGWKQPLPDHIPIGVDHGMSVPTIVGSGRPFVDPQGNLRVRGTFASGDLAQSVRALVNEGHLRTVSVEYLEDRSGTKSGAPQRELVGGAFVYLPSNRDAKVLSSKSPTTAPANSIDPDQLAQFVEAVDALPATTDDDLPAALNDIARMLAVISGRLANANAADETADDSGDDDGANALKSAAVTARVKAMLAALGPQ